MALYNPDNPKRAVNSPKAVYQIAPPVLDLVRKYGTRSWRAALKTYLMQAETLVQRYAAARQMQMVPVSVAKRQRIHLSPGDHSNLIRAIIEDFGARFARKGVLIYVGDTGDKVGYFDRQRLAALGVELNQRGKMPDIVLHDAARNWLLLIEAVTSHGPVNAKRRGELMKLFAASTAGLVYVTAFSTRAVAAKYLTEIAWETEVWIADTPSHLIHFNGVRFLGPYSVGSG